MLLLRKQEVLFMAEKESKKVTVNRTYKDTVFRKLFSDRKNLLSLYNAINGTAYTDETELELKVVTININDGHNEELMEQCKILGEYAQYVEIVRKNAEAMSLDVAVQNAVDECIQKGILEDFLRANRAEVIAMSIFEYDKEEEEQKLQKTYEAIGEKKKAKAIAISLWQEGDSIDKIARIVGEKEKTIREWTGEKN